MKKRSMSICIIFPLVLFLTVALVTKPALMVLGDTPTSTRISSFADLPPGLAPAMARALQDGLPSAYYLKKRGGYFGAENPAHGMEFTFTQAGPQIKSANGSWQWGITLKRWGMQELNNRRRPLTLLSTGAGWNTDVALRQAQDSPNSPNGTSTQPGALSRGHRKSNLRQELRSHPSRCSASPNESHWRRGSQTDRGVYHPW